MSTSRTSTEVLENWEEADICSGLLTWVRVDGCRAKFQRTWDYSPASYLPGHTGSMFPVRGPKSSPNNYKNGLCITQGGCHMFTWTTKGGPQVEPWVWPKCVQPSHHPYIYLLLLPLLSGQVLPPNVSPHSPGNLHLDSRGQSEVASTSLFLLLNLVMA